MSLVLLSYVALLRPFICCIKVAMLAAEGLLLFGTIDTWLLWKLSKGW